LSDLVIELDASDGVEKLVEALKSKPSARKITVYVAANDSIRSIEQIREFIVNNVSRTIVVYAKGGDQRGA
jgi:hypothetical protein